MHIFQIHCINFKTIRKLKNQSKVSYKFNYYQIKHIPHSQVNRALELHQETKLIEPERNIWLRIYSPFSANSSSRNSRCSAHSFHQNSDIAFGGANPGFFSTQTCLSPTISIRENNERETT